MNKTEMIAAIADKANLTKKDAEKALKAHFRSERESCKSRNQSPHPHAPQHQCFQVP